MERHDWTFERYAPEMSADWNVFTANSRNATFLHDRRFMDYHSDRFRDHSLVARLNGRISALLPANEETSPTGERTLVSHRGLTYGGWLLPSSRVVGAEVVSLFVAACDYLRGEGFGKFIYKAIPAIYHTIPSQDDEYALFRMGVAPDGVMLSASIDMTEEPKFSSRQRNHIRQARAFAEANGIELRETDDCATFIRLETECLRERHDVAPVHSAEELSLLKSRFPRQIRLFGAFAGDEMLAGACVFHTGTVAHLQYTFTTPAARDNGLLPLLVARLTEIYRGSCRWFDWGISTEDDGRVLNDPLHRFKISFGAGGTVCNRYTVIL